MYDEFWNFKADPLFHTMTFTWRDKINHFKSTNVIGKLLWIMHPKDNYGQHLERYYNSPRIKKAIQKIHQKTLDKSLKV